MDLDKFIASLKDAPDAPSYLEMDREKEIEYMIEHRFVFRRVLSMIPRRSEPLRVLDIGPTPFTILVKQLFPHYDVWALDRTTLLEQRFNTHGIQLRTCDLDSQSPPFDEGFFDLVVFTEVLEHVFAPPSDVLNGIKLILRDRGTLILSVPNIAVLQNRIKFAFGITPLPNPDGQMKKSWVHGHGHLHEYTMKEIVSLLEGCAYRIISKDHLRPSSADVRRRSPCAMKTRLIRAAYRAVQGLRPSFRSQILIECQKPVMV